ncbi:MAG: SusC/RagA family TonB-linked outer membrane protein [Ferruginibacter sp.]|nr:SusC/RagA family TonB-linked outer membrane protein [Ferruginibacter sp.]
MKLLVSVLMVLLSISISLHGDAQSNKKTENKIAQTTIVTISGMTRDAETNAPLNLVTISDDSKKAIGASKEDGSFSIRVPKGSYINFSTVSFSGQRLLVNDNADNKIIALVHDSKELERVVVTALGITRKQKALGFSIQTLGQEDMNDAHSNNWSAALSGKVAGLNLLSSGSGPLNSTRIILRGETSMESDKNNALIVVDGIPKNSGMTSAGVSNAYGAGAGNDIPVDYGNGIADINPDDIESITVLKGAGAAALYGSRAAGGALIITTKSGARKGKGIGVTFNSNSSFNTVLKWPDYQYQYGQGTGKALNANGEKYYSYGSSADGLSTSGTSSAFGPKFNGQQYFQYDPAKQGQGAERTLWEPYKNGIKDYWRTGFTLSNNISLEGGNENGSARASVTHTKNEWIMPNTGFERIVAAFSANYKMSDRLKVTAKANYTNKQSDNLPGTGYNNQSIAYFMIFQNPNVDINWYKDRWKKGFEQLDQLHPYSSFIDNPYLIAYEMTNSVNNNNISGNLAATYQVSKKFDLMVRSGIDMTAEQRRQQRPFTTANYLRGYFKQQNINDYEVNSDALFTYHDKFSKDIELSVSAGANTMTHKYYRLDAYVDGLVIPAIYKLSNGSGPSIVTATDRNKKVNSVYGMANFSYKGKYFVDVTGRNDWSSTLPLKNNSYFYPSVNTSVVLSDIFKLPAQVSFAKARFSIAQVGNDTDPYKTRMYYGTSEFPASGSVQTTLHNANLKPEISTSKEAGIDIRLFKSRLNVDLTIYQNITRNQILNVPLEYATGYNLAVLNSGAVRNRGIEVVIGAQPVKTQHFKWGTTITWSKNKNRVMELIEGMGGKQDIGYGGNATLQARIGGTTGDIYGFGFVRSPEGAIVYTTDGLPVRPADISFIGNAFADWKGGFKNEFSYKSYRFSFLIDGQYGGIIYSQTHHKMTEQGKLVHTLRGREENFIIGDGVVMDAASGKYVTNTKKVLPVDYYVEYYRRANVEANSFDASFLKLREVRIEYTIPATILKNGVIKGATFALYGRDLLMLTSFPMFDPETASLNGSTLLPGVEMGQLPSSRTMGINFTLKF